MQNKFKVGSVVLSTAGHDSGNYFVVVEVVNDNFVKISDGKSRLLEKAKLKKVKHLKDTYIFLDEIAQKLNTNEIVHNKNIQTALKKAICK